jgi:hypothetical protein
MRVGQLPLEEVPLVSRLHTSPGGVIMRSLAMMARPSSRGFSAGAVVRLGPAILLAASAATALCGYSTEGDLVVGKSGGVCLSISGSAVLGHLGRGGSRRRP